MTKKPLLQITVVIISLLVSALLLEGFFRLNERFSFIKKDINYAVFYEQSEAKVAEYKNLDWGTLEQSADPYEKLRGLKGQSVDYSQRYDAFKMATPDEVVTHHGKTILRPSGETLYDVDFTIDSDHRRITLNNPKKTNKALLAFGCSYMFGEGVADGETLPSQLALELKDTKVYNLGFDAFGVTDHLASLDRPSYKKLDHINETQVDFLYLFLGAHLDRSFCPLFCYYPENNWMLMKDWYEVEEGQPVRKGQFLDRKGIYRLFPFLTELSFVKYFRFHWPDVRSERKIKDFVVYLKALAEKTSQRIPLQNKWFVIEESLLPKTAMMLKPLVEKEGFQVIDLSGINFNGLAKSKTYIPFDWHPSLLGNSIKAKMISSHLKKK